MYIIYIYIYKGISLHLGLVSLFLGPTRFWFILRSDWKITKSTLLRIARFFSGKASQRSITWPKWIQTKQMSMMSKLMLQQSYENKLLHAKAQSRRLFFITFCVQSCHICPCGQFLHSHSQGSCRHFFIGCHASEEPSLRSQGSYWGSPNHRSCSSAQRFGWWHSYVSSADNALHRLQLHSPSAAATTGGATGTGAAATWPWRGWSFLTFRTFGRLRL